LNNKLAISQRCAAVPCKGNQDIDLIIKPHQLVKAAPTKKDKKESQTALNQ